MLKNINRLRRRKDFKSVYTNSQVIHDSYIVLYIDKQNQQHSNPVRVGFVVSKKIHKRAVVRNKIKRRLREAVRQILKEEGNSINNFQNIIFIARKSLIGVKTDKIKDIITKMVDNIK